VEQPVWLSKVMSYRIQPAAKRLGIAKGHREEVELKNYCVPCVSLAKNGVSGKSFILLASPTGFEPVLPP
jgi:hypothetical protein